MEDSLTWQRRQWHPTPVLLPGKIPWTQEPGRLQSMGSVRVRHDWATSLSLFTFMHWRRKWQPTPEFLPGESQGRGPWWAAIYVVARSRTQLKRPSSSSSSSSLTWIFIFHSLEAHTHTPLLICAELALEIFKTFQICKQWSARWES